MIRDTDVCVPMRDGVKLCVDVYRPDTEEKLPALLAFAIYNKDFQGPDMAEALPPQPAWTPLWTGPLEAGDTHFLVSRGYVHVIGSAARRRQVGRRRLARMGQLRPDRMDRRSNPGATAMSAWSAFPASAPSSFTSPSSSRRISRRSSRSTRAAPMACSAASARNIRAACCTCSAIWSAISPPCISTGARPGKLPEPRETLLAGGDGQSRLPHVSERVQSAGAEGPAHAALSSTC